MFKKFWSYLTFKKMEDEGNKPNFNLRVMHGINRISILMFVVGILFLIIKLVTK